MLAFGSILFIDNLCWGSVHIWTCPEYNDDNLSNEEPLSCPSHQLLRVYKKAYSVLLYTRQYIVSYCIQDRI